MPITKNGSYVPCSEDCNAVLSFTWKSPSRILHELACHAHVPPECVLVASVSGELRRGVACGRVDQAIDEYGRVWYRRVPTEEVRPGVCERARSCIAANFPQKA